MNVFVDAGDDEFVPKGSFVKLDIAWEIIKDFFNDSLNKSDKIKWLMSDIDWSEYENMI